MTLPTGSAPLHLLSLTFQGGDRLSQLCHTSPAAAPSSAVPNQFISGSNEALNFAVFDQKVQYSRNMPGFVIKIR